MAAKPILTSPRTESQLRTVLSRLEQNIEVLVTDLGDLEDRIIRTTGPAGAGAAVSSGEVVYASSDGGVSPAQANADLTSRFAGIALNSAAVGEEVIYQSAGVVTGMSGLTTNAFYYISATTPGLLTTTPPSTSGQYVVLVGLALTSTDLLLMPEPGILL